MLSLRFNGVTVHRLRREFGASPDGFVGNPDVRMGVA